MTRRSRTRNQSSHRAFCLQTYMGLHARRDALRKELQQNALVDAIPIEFSPDRMVRKSSNSSSTSRGSFGSLNQDIFSTSARSSVSSDSSVSSASSTSISGLTHHMSMSTAVPSSALPQRRRRFSIPLDSVDASTLEIAETRQRLRAVNQQIKSTLTAMLHDEKLKKDEKYRRWINSRLEEVELALADSV